MGKQEIFIEEQNNNGGKKYKAIAIFTAVLSTIYLLNFSMGIFEIPDVLPIIGHIDETVAAGALFAALRYLGIDVFKFLGK